MTKITFAAIHLNVNLNDGFCAYGWHLLLVCHSDHQSCTMHNIVGCKSSFSGDKLWGNEIDGDRQLDPRGWQIVSWSVHIPAVNYGCRRSELAIVLLGCSITACPQHQFVVVTILNRTRWKRNDQFRRLFQTRFRQSKVVEEGNFPSLIGIKTPVYLPVTIPREDNLLHYSQGVVIIILVRKG